ncbi:MAG: TIGR04282 family arsenosugar biosynthesis glycosyltransferase [Spartobacteria bacterium]
MTKVPQAGKVKTRLTPPLTPEEAAGINTCFLRDVSLSILRACQNSPARGVGVYTPVGGEAAYGNILPPDFFMIPQRGDGFGERLVLAVEDLFKAGFESVCLINSDSPTVPAASFAEAANKISEPGDRIVLGPSEDGGYYLIGVKQQHRRLFQEIDWSTERVFKQTKQRAKEIGVEVHELPIGFDVDDGTALSRLCAELLGREARSTSDVAVETRNFLSQIIEREGRGRICGDTNE